MHRCIVDCSVPLYGGVTRALSPCCVLVALQVDWTPDLHRKFVQAVEQLGVEKAIPSRILEIMGVKCLTRHNIASHLQKYRSHRRHLAAREAEAANWQQQRKAADAPLWPVNKPGSGSFSGWGPFGAPAVPPVPGTAPMGYAAGLPTAGPVPGRPVMGLPPPGVVQGMPHMGAPVPGAPAGTVSLGQPQPTPMGAPPVPAIGMPMQVWGHPTVDHAHAHMWQRPGAVYPMPPPAWFGPDGSVWHYPTVSPCFKQCLRAFAKLSSGIAACMQRLGAPFPFVGSATHGSAGCLV